jgi:hypothetical protein
MGASEMRGSMQASDGFDRDLKDQDEFEHLNSPSNIVNHPWSSHFAESGGKPPHSAICESMRARNEQMRYEAAMNAKT